MGDEALVGRLLDGRYRIGERIARGGMASVFLGTDERLDRQVAIKVMHRGLGDPAAFTERFKREAKAAAKLNHRNVVSVFDQGHDGDAIYLVMEYVPGHTLRDVMRDESPMAPARALQIIEPVLVALATAHGSGLIHRDVKPENVLITPDGEVKVADFGLARAVTAATTATSSTLIGTVSYLAPEIVSNTGADARSDVYAVGAMLFEMMTGEKPHAGESPIQVAYKHVHEDIGPPSALVPSIPPYVDALVARATVRDITQRAADAKVLLQYVHLVKDALADGLDDDPELTDHLTPVPGDGGGEATVVTGAIGTGARAPRRGGAEHSEPTMQWTFDDPAASRRIIQQPVEADDVHAERPERPVSRGRILLVGAVVLAVLAALLGYWLGVGRYVDAPVLAGMAETQAEKEASDLGFDFKVVERQFSEDEPLGTVISTDPEAGGRILPGGTIEAVVSKGPERYEVPDLKGETLKEAENLLKDRSLTLGDVKQAYSETIKKGSVIKVDGVKVGTNVKKGTAIDVVVSKGKEPVDIPDVLGEKSRDAYDRLRDLGFNVSLGYGYSDEYGKGEVMAQSDTGSAFKGDTITITISKGGTEVRVPRVKGMAKYDAIHLLEAAGLKVEISASSRDKAGNWIVLFQSPSAGSKVKRGTTVTIAN